MKKPGKSHGFTGLIEITGGASGIRTRDPYVANVMLYQLSYSPVLKTRHNVSEDADLTNEAVEKKVGMPVLTNQNPKT